MRIPIRLALPLLACFAAIPAMAQQADPIAAIRANRWADAERDVASYADPVARKLITFYRLLAPGAATADEITAFMQQNPDWPDQAILERRRQEAIASEPDQAAALAQCERNQLILPQAMLRCADAEAIAGNKEAAAGEARHAWLTGITEAAGETAFLRRWSGAIHPDDEWQRFQHLAWHDPKAAARQVARLDAKDRPAAEARLALQRDTPKAESQFTALPSTRQQDPGLMLDYARWLRRNDRTADAHNRASGRDPAVASKAAR